jgi:hypothetical protein
MLSLAALLTNTLLFIFLDRIYTCIQYLCLCDYARVREKAQKGVTQRRADRLRKKQRERDHQLFPLCVHATQCAPDYQTSKKVHTKRGRNRACF